MLLHHQQYLLLNNFKHFVTKILLGISSCKSYCLSVRGERRDSFEWEVEGDLRERERERERERDRQTERQSTRWCMLGILTEGEGSVQLTP
jgi:hypothetical protein